MIKEFRGKYRFLSNFWPAPVTFDGITYPSVEHYYQAMKTVHLPTRRLIAKMPKPGDAKRYAKKVQLRKNWDAIKVSVMEAGLRAKFSIPALKHKLVATGSQTLQEGNLWHDRFWGVDLKTGKGLNTLGCLLMKIREEVR